VNPCARWLLLSVVLPVLLAGACGMKSLDPVVAAEAGAAGAPDTGPPPLATIDSGLVAHWTFDETSGDTVGDIVGHHDGTKFGGTWQPNGRVNGALSLMYGQRVEIDNFPQATASFAVSLWVRFRPGEIGTMRGTLISNQVPASNQNPSGGWEVNAPDGSNPARLEFAYPLRDTPQSNSNWVHAKCCAAAPGSWIHLTAMIDEHQQVTVYNGENKQVTQSGAPIRPGSMQLFMGTELNERPNGMFQGTLDEIRIYNRTLTLDEIRLLDNPP
jgi:Concanavalin A-like lectin/glucanases superfamily